jgi:zinc protease
MLLGTILSAMTPLPHESLQFKELTLKIPEITRKILSNGMELFYAQDSSLPIVRATLYVPGGSHRDPAAATGLSSLLSTVQIAGGTRHLTPDELDMQLESLGAEIDTGAQSRYQTVSLKCLRTDFKNILDLFFEVALHPRFDPSRFDLEKKNALESIRRRDDDAAGIARRKFANIVYRPHPEGNETTMETIGSISRDNLINSHRKRFQPDGSQLLVVGDVDLKTLESMLSPYLAQWKPTGRKLVDPPKVTREFKAERYFVQKSVPQVKIRIGHKSIKLSNPDLFPLMVMDRILGGGGFNSRLMKRIRTELGLAYSVYSWIGADVFYSTIGVDCGTKTEGSVQSLREILSAIKKIQDQPVSNEELELARNTIVNQFVFKFATRHQVASRILFFEQAGLPDDFMETYLKAIEAVTVKDVQRVAREYFKSDGLKILLVGDFAKVRAEIEKEFGSFKEIKLPDYGSGSGKAGKSASLSR